MTWTYVSRPQLSIGGDPESRVAARTRRCVVRPSRHAIPVAVRGMAQIRASSKYFVVARWIGAAIPRNSPRILTPFPYVPGDIEQAKAIRSIGVYRGASKIAICNRVVIREDPLPDIALVSTARCQLVAPRKSVPFEPSPRCVLPLDFGWQAHARPFAICKGVVPAHMNDWVVLAATDA